MQRENIRRLQGQYVHVIKCAVSVVQGWMEKTCNGSGCVVMVIQNRKETTKRLGRLSSRECEQHPGVILKCW